LRIGVDPGLASRPRSPFLAAGAVADVGNASFIGVFQVLWEGAASSRLSTGRQLP